ncbi:MAG: site-specific integrase [Planctomyces sp.]|nr:site-specific integrase [Planctomyces sp.]
MASQRLVEFLEQKFIPNTLGLTAAAVKNYREAVRSLNGWAGVDCRMHEVTESLIERYMRSTILEGSTVDAARKKRAYLRRIVRHWSPDTCMKVDGRRPHEGNQLTRMRGLTNAELDQPGSIMEFWRVRYVPEKMIGCRKSSILQMTYAISNFAKCLGRCPLMNDLTDDNLRNLQRWKLQKGDRATSVNSCVKDLLSFWRHAHQLGLLTDCPKFISKLRSEKKIPVAWSLEELSAILHSAQLQMNPKKGLACPPSLFWPALIRVGYDTGLRRSTLFSLRTIDFNPERGELRARPDDQKTRVEQIFSLSPETVISLRVMIASRTAPHQFLFPWNFTKEHSHDCFRQILKRAGVWKGTYSGCAFHQLRRTTATHLTASLGIESAARHLGHTSSETTRRYVDPRFLAEHRVSDHLPRIPQRPIE